MFKFCSSSGALNINYLTDMQWETNFFSSSDFFFQIFRPLGMVSLWAQSLSFMRLHSGCFLTVEPLSESACILMCLPVFSSSSFKVFNFHSGLQLILNQSQGKVRLQFSVFFLHTWKFTFSGPLVEQTGFPVGFFFFDTLLKMMWLQRCGLISTAYILFHWFTCLFLSKYQTASGGKRKEKVNNQRVGGEEKQRINGHKKKKVKDSPIMRNVQTKSNE